MTEDQKQALQEAAEAIIEAARTIVASAVKLVETILQAVAAATRDFYEYTKDIIAVIVKEKKKLQCNNWRRMHGMTLLHRNKRSRQGQRILNITG